MGKGGVGRIAKGPTRAADPTKLSCEEFAGPKGEGKYRMDPRQRMFTSEFNRFGEQKSEEYKINIGPASYQAPDSSVLRNEFTGSTWMPRAERWSTRNIRDWELPADPSFTFDRDFRQNWVAESGGARVGSHVHNIPIGKDRRFKAQPGENASWCAADFYDTSSAIDYLRYPGRDAPGGTNLAKAMFESKSARFPDDPAVHLGPGSHDYKYPDELTMEKKMVRRDPSFLGGVSHQGINNGEIKNEPLIERSVRHGDPGGRGPGHYGIAEYRPRNPDDLTNQPVPADNPGRPSSSMLSIPRSDKDYKTTAGHVESTWSLAQDARLWTVGGQTGASVGGLASAADRFDYDAPSRIREGMVQWRSNFTGKKMIRELQRRAKREQAASRRQGGKRGRQRRRRPSAGAEADGPDEESHMEPGSPATGSSQASIRPDSMLGRYGEIAASLREGSEKFTSDEDLGLRESTHREIRRPVTRG
jgi:hypothetical protein